MHGTLSCPARILSLNLSQKYASGRWDQLAEIDLVYATEEAHFFHGGNHCAGSRENRSNGFSCFQTLPNGIETWVL